MARYDHYCGWLAQPVGEENHRYFLAFLFMTSVMLLYAGRLVGLWVAALLWAVVSMSDGQSDRQTSPSALLFDPPACPDVVVHLLFGL